MLLSSDDERKEHVPCLAEGRIEKRKGHEQISVDELVGRQCRCQQKTCFQQFVGYERAVTAKRSDLASLDPEDRITQ